MDFITTLISIIISSLIASGIAIKVINKKIKNISAAQKGGITIQGSRIEGNKGDGVSINKWQ